MYYRTCAIISRGLYIFYPISKDHFFVFKEVFQKILSLCMACIQERVLIKSGLWWHAYSIWTSLIISISRLEILPFRNGKKLRYFEVFLNHWLSLDKLYLYSWTKVQFCSRAASSDAPTTDTQWRHKLKKSENLGQCGRQNMLRPCQNIWEWELIFGLAVKAIFLPGVRSPCCYSWLYYELFWMCLFVYCSTKR